MKIEVLKIKFENYNFENYLKIKVLKIGVLKIKVLKVKFGHQKIKNKEEDTWPLDGVLEGGHAWPTRSGPRCKAAALLVAS